MLKPWKTIWTQRQLIWSLSAHSIQSRYRTSWFGLIWPVLQPILLIGVFSLVFNYIMPLKWSGEGETAVSFPIFLFSGLLMFTLFSEVVSRAPTLILENINLVKKVVFPLEVLPVANVITAVIYFCINMLVFFVFLIIAGYGLPVALFSFLLVLIPFVLFLMGLSWFLSGLTVYVRDTLHIIGIVVSAMMFLSPVFYPLASVPELIRPYLALNPLSTVIESFRNIVFHSMELNLFSTLSLWLVGALAFYLGYIWFSRVKEGFSDVL